MSIGATFNNGERFIETKGVGFQPNQADNIEFQYTPSVGGVTERNLRTVKSDITGGFIDHMPLNVDISHADVVATDLGSGETSTAEIQA